MGCNDATCLSGGSGKHGMVGWGRSGTLLLTGTGYEGAGIGVAADGVGDDDDDDEGSEGSTCLSRRWGGENFRYMRLLAMSAVVSDITQKEGGDLTQPIVHTRGIPTSCGSLGYLGSKTARFGAGEGVVARR